MYRDNSQPRSDSPTTDGPLHEKALDCATRVASTLQSRLPPACWRAKMPVSKDKPVPANPAQTIREFARYPNARKEMGRSSGRSSESNQAPDCPARSTSLKGSAVALQPPPSKVFR